MCNFDGKRTEADRLHVGRRHGGPQTTEHDQKEEFVDAFSVVFDGHALGARVPFQFQAVLLILRLLESLLPNQGIVVDFSKN